MRPAAAGLLLCLLLASPARAGDVVTAADVTEPGRSLDRALRVCLGPGVHADARRTVLFLIDPTPSLRAAGFADAFERALAASAEGSARRAVGIAVVGDRKGPRVEPGHDDAAALAAVRAALAHPRDGFRNLYADVRHVAAMFARRSGQRDLVLVSLENGDGEDDLEGTVSSLHHAKVHCTCIAREAFLSDSFYVSGTRTVPRGLETGAGDGPWLTLPWGWLFQTAIANETTPSGYAQYGLTRLAAASGGRVFLVALSGAHRCAIYGTCPFCNEDHQPADESFQAQRVRALAPSALPRSKAGAALARDPWFRATLTAWAAASKAGLVRSRPAVRLIGHGLKAESRPAGTWAPLLTHPGGFPRLAARADKLAATCARIRAALEDDLGKIDDDAGSPRQRAMAELTRVMLAVTHANLVAYACWCREVAPTVLGGDPDAYQPPEVSPLAEARQVVGISYTPQVLCHGVGPFRALHLPGGEVWKAELDRLQPIFEDYMRRYAHTPYAIALRHQGLARFLFTYRGTVVTPPRPQVGSSTDKQTTETARPSRGGTSSGGTTSGGATTGGG
jgi:hypothetical protein